MTIRRLFCLIALFYIQPCLSYYRGGSILTDLTSSDSTEIESDASLWILSSKGCSSCNGTYTTPPNTCGIPQEIILGGPGILGPSGDSTSGQYFEREYWSLGSSQAATALEFDLWVFYNTIPSSPSATTLFSLTIDSGRGFGGNRDDTLENSCELDYTDSGGVIIKAFYKFHIRLFFGHHWRDRLNVKFQSQLTVPSTVSSFGLRNFRYYLDSPIDIDLTINPATFPCSSGRAWNGAACVASVCHAYCATCTGSTYNDCTSCNNGYYDYGNGTCLSTCDKPFSAITSNGYPYLCQPKCPTTFFWHYSQNCTSTCPLPLTSSTDSNNLKICSNPCYYNDATSAYVNKSLYPDQTCLSTCPLPLSVLSPGLCVTPCTNVNDYAFQNGSCTSQCISPLLGSTVNNIKYCKSPCSGQYIYLDGSCSTDCLAPLGKFDESADIKYCRTPCANVNDYVFPNGTCISQCPSLLDPSTVRGNNFCNSPCPGQFIYSNNGSCFSGCLSPLVKMIDPDPDIKFCVNPCESEDLYLYINGSCEETCPEPLISRTEPGTKYCFSPCDPEDFLYPNGSCFDTCDFPLSEVKDSIAKFCVNPCDSYGEFLYPNGSCFEDCSVPLSIKTEPIANFCVNPCDSYDKFLFPNGSCFDACNFPLSESIEAVAKFCFNPCDSDNKFLYPNGSCSETCDFPLSESIESVAKYCFSPCDSYGRFLYPNGSCYDACNFPLSERIEAVAKFCFNPCDLNHEFLYPNGSCYNACNFPLSERIETVAKFCLNPCDSYERFLYSNGSCYNACNFPLSERIEAVAKFCFNPCDLNHEFLYPNGSCISTCSFPLSSRTEPIAKHCFSPCSSYSEYLYLYGNCSSECPFPLSSRTESVAKYCSNPCSSTDMYRYPNGSCLSNCPSPFVKSQLNTVNQCKTPCTNLQDYFYETDQVCKPTCVSPFEPSKFDIIKLCSLTIQITIEEAQAAQSTVAAVASQGEATGATMKATSSFSSGNPALALLAGQASMLFYIRYINVNYTAKLKLVFLLQGGTPFSFTLGLNMPNGLKEKIKDRELPGIFEKYKLHSSFLYNYWDTMSSLLLALLLIGMLVLCKSGFGKFPRITRIFTGVLSILKWNIPLMILCGGFGDVYFYASLQIQSASFDSFLEILSLLLSVLMIFSCVGILLITIKIVKDFLKPENLENKKEETEKKWQNFELLYGSYERTSLATFAYMALFLSRTIVFNLIVANLYKYPLAQAILINVISFTMFGYLIMKRPLKNLLDLVQLFLNEIFVIIVNICVLILAIMDQAGINGQGLRNDVCETIIKIIMIFSSSSLGFVALQMLISIVFFYKLLRRLNAQGQLNPRGLLKALFFEEKGATGEKLPVQVQLQRKPTIMEISHNNQSELIENNTMEDLHVTNNTLQQMNETECPKETSEIIIPRTRRHYKPRIRLENSRNIGNNLSFLDRSTIEMLPSEGSFDHTLGLNTDQNDLFTGMNQQVNEESNHKDPMIWTIDPIKPPVQEKRDFSELGTISQFRKMRNYLKRNGDQKQ